MKDLWRNSPELVSALARRGFRNMDIRNIRFIPVGDDGYAVCNVRVSEELLDMQGVDFSGAQLSNVFFKYCDLRGANFIGAKLSNVRFVNCMFDYDSRYFGADIIPFRRAEIRAEYMPSYLEDNAKLCYILDIYSPVDTDGKELIAYKKVYVFNGEGYVRVPVIAKLRIPFYAKRITYEHGKCRAECAEVLDLVDYNGNHYSTALSKYSNFLTYRVGHMVYADSFDEDPITVCTHGIHFFLREDEAWEY